MAERDDLGAVAAADELARRYGRVHEPGRAPWRSLKRRGAGAARPRATRPVALAAEEVELARCWGAPGALGRALRVLGTLEGAAGLPLLEEAVAVLRARTARLEQAKALAALGSALRRAAPPGRGARAAARARSSSRRPATRPGWPSTSAPSSTPPARARAPTRWPASRR